LRTIYIWIQHNKRAQLAWKDLRGGVKLMHFLYLVADLFSCKKKLDRRQKKNWIRLIQIIVKLAPAKLHERIKIHVMMNMFLFHIPWGEVDALETRM
ncbi:hypothetical protein ACJX0J_014884, partial [Zea mays]